MRLDVTLSPRLAAAALLLVFVVPASPAQKSRVVEDPPKPPPRFAPLSGVAKARFITARIDFTLDQEEKVAALLDQFAEYRRMAADVGAVSELFQQLEAALAREDEDEVGRIKAELRKLGASEDAEREFYDGLRALLTSEQVKQLEAADAFLSHHPTGRLRPLDVLRLAQSLGLSEEQQGRIREAEDRFRRSVNQLADFEQLRIHLLEQLVEDVRGVLNDSQQTVYDKRVSTFLMPDAPVAAGAADENVIFRQTLPHGMRRP